MAYDYRRMTNLACWIADPHVGEYDKEDIGYLVDAVGKETAHDFYVAYGRKYGINVREILKWIEEATYDKGREYGAEEFGAEDISDFTVMFMFGYLDQKSFVDAIRFNDISASQLEVFVNRMNDAWGGYDGLLEYLSIYQNEGEDVADYFTKHMKETYQKGGSTYTQYYEFDDDYSKEQFMRDYAEHNKSQSAEEFAAKEWAEMDESERKGLDKLFRLKQTTIDKIYGNPPMFGSVDDLSEETGYDIQKEFSPSTSPYGIDSYIPTELSTGATGTTVKYLSKKLIDLGHQNVVNGVVRGMETPNCLDCGGLKGPQSVWYRVHCGDCGSHNYAYKLRHTRIGKELTALREKSKVPTVLGGTGLLILGYLLGKGRN